ncbi:S-adenosyl-L-methionine-dependent methyltransferase [Xylogone sp. PMI_703]|nr:S-adenosyl-L-methionine-dependent methyltransferase [Xylogone sp. PMI_703]
MASADQLISHLQGISASSFANEVERVRARDALFETLRKVQSPWDIVWDHNWVSGATNASIKTLIDAGVFRKWAECGSMPKTCTELAELTGADEMLIKRMMRQISGQHLVVEMAEDTFAPTPWAMALAADPALSAVYGEFYSQLNNPMFRSLPYFLKENGFKSPTDVNNCNWQFWKKSSNNLFQDLAINPAMASDFHAAMQCHSKYNLTSWPEMYPTNAIVSAAKPGRALVVDIGGSRGHDLEKFRLRHPEIPDGSLILQDLPDVVENVQVDRAIEPQAYDFFTPQPVKGARVYFMHNVLHDWPDDSATTILKYIGTAMEKGYSRLLIHESLISRVKPLARVTVSDITMMACLAAKERSESEWAQLIKDSGLRLVKIWRPPQSVESIIEAELN